MKSKPLVLSTSEFRLNEDSIQLNFHLNIAEIREVWDANSDGNLMFGSAFYQAIENAPPSDLQFVYAVYRKDSQVIGLAYFQAKHFSLSESLKVEEVEKKCGKNAVMAKMKSSAAKRIHFQAFTCGNLLVTGDFGYQFKEAYQDNSFQLISQTSTILAKSLNDQKNKFKTIMLKDFFDDRLPPESEVKTSGFTGFRVQPNMLLEIKWPTFDAYLAAIKSKYRGRYKKSQKKAENIIRKKLTEEEISLHKLRIHELYMQTASEAGFNLFFLHENYFFELKRHLGDLFDVYGYFEKDKLIAFYSIFKNHHELEAHFLGYDHALNGQYQIYLNMLYDLLKIGIEEGMTQLNLSRTAMEIKSTIGAKPKEMSIYLHRTQKIQNKILPYMLKYFVPNNDWQIRNPFKD